jgi:hypothetical protein
MADDAGQAPTAGSIPYVIGQSSVVRIPIPGTPGLCLELTPRGRIPRGGSTSTIFIQDSAGKRHLRLDFGENPVTKTVDYHWNQRGTHQFFGLSDHSAAGGTGRLAYGAAKYFRYAGRVLLVAGAAVDIVSIVYASRPLRRASEVVAGWAGAWIGCEVAGAGGAAVGTALTPGVGTAAGGFLGCIVGGLGGYVGGASVGAAVFDWAEDTVFFPVAQVSQP